MLVAKSHKLFPHHYTWNSDDAVGSNSCTSFYRQRLNELKGDDWMEVDPNDSYLLNPKNIITCLLNPGDLLLWDSRTVHCSFPGDDACEDIHDRSRDRGLIRAGGLVSMMPRSRATEEVLKGRIESVRSSRTLTHWANKCALLGEEHEEEALLESRRIEIMKSLVETDESNNKVLLGWDNLSPSQKNMVR